MTSVSDIMPITSTVEFESTQSDNARTEQHNSNDDTSIHKDVTQQGSVEGVDAVTSSSMLEGSPKLQTDSSKVEEGSTESPIRSTRILSTTAARDESSTSDSSASASPDDVMSSTDHSYLKSDDTLVSSNEVTSTSSAKDSASTGTSQAFQQQSTVVSLVLEESTAPRVEHDPALQTSSEVLVSSHLTEHRSFSTSILDSQSFDSYASTQTRKKSSTSTSTSTRQYTWKTSTAHSSIWQPGMMTSTADKVTDSLEGTKGGGLAVGYAVGATVFCLLLIVVIIILIIYRKARKKTHDFAEQDITDYRSLVRSPTKRQDNDGSSAPFTPFTPSPIEETRDETAIDIPLAVSNFRAHFAAQLNGSQQKETSESAKEIPMVDLSEPSAGNAESYSVNSFKPSHPKTTAFQSAASSEV